MNDDVVKPIDSKFMLPDTNHVTDIRSALPKQHLFASSFGLHEDVKLKPFNIIGTVTQLNWDRCGLQFRVRYFNDYKQVCFEWFNIEELDSVK